MAEAGSSGAHRAPATRVVVLGGGLAGLAAAWEIAGALPAEVTIVERSTALGGLAGSFEHCGAVYPLGYHHILPTDRTLLRFLQLIGVSGDVRWRRIRMLFRIDGRLFDLTDPTDFLRLPMPFSQKLRFVTMMLRTYRTADWSQWHGRTAAELVDGWAGPAVRQAMFEPLCRVKFELPPEEVSAAWLGARLHAREGSGHLGYIPDTNWTKVLCEGVVRLARERGVRIHAGVGVTDVITGSDRVLGVRLEDGDCIDGDVFVSGLPTSTLARLLPGDPVLDSVEYSALLSLVAGTRQEIPDSFYWLNLLSPALTASGLFMLTTLNPTIGPENERCVNFLTHLHDSGRPLFRLPEEALVDRYLDDYRTVFGIDLAVDWAHLSRIPAYSPVFVPGYRNPDVRSAVWGNLYLTGNYRTYPSVASTGTALRSGLESAQALIADQREMAPTLIPLGHSLQQRRRKAPAARGA